MRKWSAMALVALFAGPAMAAPLTGPAAYGDWRTDAPGVVRKITPNDLPPPDQHLSVGLPAVLARPAGAELKTLPGFTVAEFAKLDGPRQVRVAPNGDIFIAESDPGKIRVLRAADGAAKPSDDQVFAEGLNHPFGIAFYPPGPNPQWVYVANTNSRGALPVSERRPESARSGRDHRADAAARRRPLDARRRLHARRQDDVRVGRLGQQRRRGDGEEDAGRDSRLAGGPRARRRLGAGGEPRRRAVARSRGQGPARVRRRHPQLRLDGDQPDHRRALVRHQRARPAGRQPAARLRDPGEGRAASTAGPGTTSATTRTRAAPASGRT